jgi:hypothetical protein
MAARIAALANEGQYLFAFAGLATPIRIQRSADLTMSLRRRIRHWLTKCGPSSQPSARDHSEQNIGLRRAGNLGVSSLHVCTRAYDNEQGDASRPPLKLAGDRSSLKAPSGCTSGGRVASSVRDCGLRHTRKGGFTALDGEGVEAPYGIPAGLRREHPETRQHRFGQPQSHASEI